MNKHKEALFFHTVFAGSVRGHVMVKINLISYKNTKAFA